MKAWSISTTLRSPDRVEDWTRGFEAFVGATWDKPTQVAYQTELIRLKAYEPQKFTEAQKQVFEDSSSVMTAEMASQIFNQQHYQDPPMRGRNSMAPIRSLGLVRVKPQIRLTEIGQSLLDGKLTLSDALLNFALKWELPIPGHGTFKESEGFYIRPFVGMLTLITEVNQQWKSLGHEPVGLSRDEFNLFVPTLINAKDVSLYADRIIRIRKSTRGSMPSARRKDGLETGFLSHLNNLPHSDDELTDKDLGTLRDYGDNAIRYFRPTGFIEFRGAGRFIDISQASMAQVQQLVGANQILPKGFETEDDYYDYVGDLEAYSPPWSEPSQVEEVKQYLRDLVMKEVADVTPIAMAKPQPASLIKGEDAEIVALKNTLTNARLGKLKAASRTSEFVVELIEDYELLKKKNYPGYLEAPVALEFNTFKAFLSLNDALTIQPNYPVGDDGEPISTAPGGGTDLYCEYESFGLSVEVTLSKGRSQWVMEGQPVQRHLRDIESKIDKPVFSLFLAPSLYPDTINTFWIANVFGYEGGKQKIIPLNFDSWQAYLGAVTQKIESGALRHTEMLEFFSWAMPAGDELQDSRIWAARINNEDNLRELATKK